MPCVYPPISIEWILYITWGTYAYIHTVYTPYIHKEMTYTEYKLKYREVPPYKFSWTRLAGQIILVLSIVAFIGLWTWVIMFLISLKK